MHGDSLVFMGSLTRRKDTNLGIFFANLEVVSICLSCVLVTLMKLLEVRRRKEVVTEIMLKCKSLGLLLIHVDSWTWAI